MKLEDLTLGTVTRAVDAYLELAYGGSSGPKNRPDLELGRRVGGGREAGSDPIEVGSAPEAGGEPTLDQILGLFQEDLAEDRGRSCRRYTMRLGNRNYPFMKLLLQEHLVAGEFYFGVDTHDDMSIDPSYPDYEAWMQLRRFNRELREQIEQRFGDAGLPTAATIRGLCEAREVPRPADGPNSGTEILVVDDEVDLAAAVSSRLRSWGYATRVVGDGVAALAEIRAKRPSLVVLDYELPEKDGLEVLTELREDPSTERIPVLLCTASKIGLADIRKADGFLAKPFPEDLLHEMVLRLLDRAHAEEARGS